MIVYKVVASMTLPPPDWFWHGYLYNKLISFNYLFSRQVVMKYAIGKKSASGHGKLMVFDSVDNARRMIVLSAPRLIDGHGDRRLNLHILLCFAGGVERVRSVLNTGRRWNPGSVSVFWDSRYYKQSADDNPHLMPAPEGTLACDWLIPMYKVG